ncbi:putative NTPase [Pseudoalteromonas phage C7]|uniref:putative NTPase n=1 Tax=Pseudoalteromonas phage C7 TaxID=2510494 RepID=UPI001018CFA1|nr:putative NTPase [Pseudoalteromonas phage C7]QAY18005.1 putative NTPase [Pseudoalteromonas phage C7]
MAISLDSISKPKTKPMMATILGEAGVGKTTFAANHPNPIFIRVEDGLTSLQNRDDVNAFPLVSHTNEVFDAINVLATQEHNYGTLIIDSVTKLNELFEKEVIESDPKAPRSINQALGGYGAGHAAVAEKHRTLRNWCESLRDTKGMNVLFLAHADNETIELPDQDPYTRYTLRLNKRSVSSYVDNVDLVGLVRLRTFTTGDGDRKKATSDGARELVCTALASSVSKNRYGIVKTLPLGENENPLTDYVPWLKQSLAQNQ